MRKLSIILLCIISLNKISTAQIAYSNPSTAHLKLFYRHLISEHLYDDACTLLKNLRETSMGKQSRDSITTDIATLYFSINYIDSANYYFKQIDKINDSVTIRQAIETAFSQNDTTAINRYIHQYTNYLDSNMRKTYTISLSVLRHETLDGSVQSLDSSAIGDIVNRYSHFKPKSPVIAGLLSTIVPGLGKRYLGYKKTAKSAFSTNIILAGVMTEILLNTANPFPIAASIAAFGTFYIGNIWGSVLLTKKRERDFYNQICVDITEIFKNRLHTTNKVNTLIADNLSKQKNQLLETEYLYWQTNEPETKCTLLIKKSQDLKQLSYPDKAIFELQRLDSIKGHETNTILYEKAFNSFLSKDYDKSYNYLLAIPDSIKLHERAITKLWLMTLIENKQWERCKEELSSMVDTTKAVASEIRNMPTTIPYKSPIKAQQRSTIFPGMGLFYDHKPMKGITNLILETGFGFVTATLFISGYYFTPIIIGIYPFLRFYMGGRQLSYTKAIEWNTQHETELQKTYKNVILKITEYQ